MMQWEYSIDLHEDTTAMVADIPNHQTDRKQDFLFTVIM